MGGSNNANALLTLMRVTYNTIFQKSINMQDNATNVKTEQTSRAARIMVVSCERSPHSARKVRVNAWKKMGERRLYHLACGAVAPDPASISAVPLASLDRWSCKDKQSFTYLKLPKHFISSLSNFVYNIAPQNVSYSNVKTSFTSFTFIL